MNQPNPTHAWGKRETVDECMGPGRDRRQALKVPVTNLTKGPYIWICIESPVAFPCYYYSSSTPHSVLLPTKPDQTKKG